MRRAYLLWLFLTVHPTAALTDEPGDARRYEIRCEGELTAPGEKPHSESFTWIVDEGAPANEQVFHLGKSVCDNTVSCLVEIKPYHIRVRTVSERTESSRHFKAHFDGTINRVTGIGQAEGLIVETEGEVMKRHTMKGTFSCARHAFERAI